MAAYGEQLEVQLCALARWLPHRQDKELTIVCFGDSITRGVHLKAEEAYPYILSTLLPGVKVINSGYPGDTTQQGLARMKRDVLDHQPDYVVILFGTNDSVIEKPGQYRVAADRYAKNLSQMISELKKINARVVLCTLLPINSTPYFERHPKEYYDAEGGLEAIVQKYRAAVRAMARVENVPVVDIYPEFAKDMTLLRDPPDGVHPNARGTNKIATLVGQKLMQIIRPCSAQTLSASK